MNAEDRPFLTLNSRQGAKKSAYSPTKFCGEEATSQAVSMRWIANTCGHKRSRISASQQAHSVSVRLPVNHAPSASASQRPMRHTVYLLADNNFAKTAARKTYC